MISLVLSIIVISSYSASFNSQQCLPVSHILLFEMFFLHILLYHTLLIFQLSNRPLLLNLFYFTSKCWSIKGLNLNSYSLFAILSLTSFLFFSFSPMIFKQSLYVITTNFRSPTSTSSLIFRPKYNCLWDITPWVSNINRYLYQ